jgi:hypothetical protein
MSRTHRFLICIALLALPPALGAQTPADSARQDSTRKEKASRPRRSFNVLTEEEFHDMEAGSAYDVVQRLRPTWLRQRGPTSVNSRSSGEVLVYVDGVAYGDVETLRGIPVGHVASMRFFSATDATTRFSVTHGGGVIEVYTRQR